MAQSLEDLEREVFQGDSSASSSSSTPAEAPPSTLTEKSSDASDDAPVSRSSESKVDIDQVDASRDESVDVEIEKIQAKESALEEVDEIVKGPRQIPFDHIMVVQHRYIHKRYTHEISPFNLGIQPADSFRKQLQMGFSYIYNFTEDFSIEALHLMAMTNVKTNLSNKLLEKARLETERVEPVLTAGASLQWAPFKAKSATVDNIYHFEGYLLLGGGMTKFESESSGMAMGGLGMRMFLNPRALFKVELRDYYDFIDNADHRVTFLIGAGLLLGGE
jgi:outer membrane beta-barrel protein